MNAQEKWKRLYRVYRDNPLDVLGVNCRSAMHKDRREAALERALEAERRKVDRLRKAALKFSKAHSTGCTRCDNPSVDPQDWYEFDAAFGKEHDGV